MPRTKLDRLSDNPETYRKTVNRVVRSAMARNDMTSMAVLGRSLGLSQTQIQYRFRTGWGDFELLKLNRMLAFTEDEQKKIMGAS